MIAKLDLGFFGFSTILIILFFLLIFATPYKDGVFTGCKKTFAPFERLVHCINFLVKLCPKKNYHLI